MGININSAQFLLAARRQGADFGRTLTVGRLHFNVYKTQLRRMAAAAGVLNETIISEIPETGEQAYAEPFLRLLGARDVESMDVSEYEGASRIHDLNLPVPHELVERYDAVCDGGTLEHVLHFTQALHNCMRMTRIGGNLFLHLPANNCCGHGFYQLSPDLFFRVLSPLNGFRVQRIVMHAVGPYGRWFEVSDPKSVGDRVELISWRPIHILVHGQKTAATPPTLSITQQTSYEDADYRRMREASMAMKSDRMAARRAAFITRLPRLAQFLRVANHAWRFYSRQSLCNRRFYKPVPRG